jgi:nicotinamide riboside kinase
MRSHEVEQMSDAPRQLGANGDRQRFKERLRQVVRHKLVEPEPK